jgi:hypothetical protein
LRAEKKSLKTIRTYLEAAQWFAAEYLVRAGPSNWSDVKARHVQPSSAGGSGRSSASPTSSTPSSDRPD